MCYAINRTCGESRREEVENRLDWKRSKWLDRQDMIHMVGLIEKGQSLKIHQLESIK